jgi:hypothetical protein
MSHRSVRLLIEAAAKSLSDNIQFGYGRRSDFNQSGDKYYPYVWLLPLTATTVIGETRTKTWSIVLVVINMDKSDSESKEFDCILDEMDDIVDKIVIRIDDWYRTTDDIVGSLTITNVNQVSIIKEDADIHTGWLCTFQMTVSDDFDYCANEPSNLADEWTS